MPNMISLKEYARHRGVSPKACRSALQAGRITAERDGAGNWRIDPAKADAEWERNTRPDKAKGRATAADAVANTLPPAPDEPPEDGAETGRKVTAENSRQLFFIGAAEEKLRKAELLDIELRVKNGELLDAAKVKADTFNITRQVRDAMMNIPDRIAADLAAESDAFEVHRKLTAEIRLALSTMAETIRAQAATSNNPKK